MSPSKKISKQTTPSSFISSFRVTKYKPQRAKFGPQRREEVKAVRNRRACLRCSLLKIKCSHDDLCTTCAQLAFALHGHERLTMSFSGCIRTRPSEASIFALYVPPNQSHSLILEKSKSLALSAITLTFASDVTWDLSLLANDILKWLEDSGTSKASKVGILSSPKFMDLVKSSTRDLAEDNFQRMIYAVSLAYTQPTKPPMATTDIHNVGCVAGHEFLKVLDQWLKPQYLQKCSENDLRALFLMVFGTILAAGYCLPASDEADKAQGNNARDMQNHLCQILAHYMIYLGSHLGLPFTNGVDQAILQGAPARWHKQGLFDWETVEDYESLHGPLDEDLLGTQSQHAMSDEKLEDNMNRTPSTTDDRTTICDGLVPYEYPHTVTTPLWTNTSDKSRPICWKMKFADVKFSLKLTTASGYRNKTSKQDPQQSISGQACTFCDNCCHQGPCFQHDSSSLVEKYPLGAQPARKAGDAAIDWGPLDDDPPSAFILPDSYNVSTSSGWLDAEDCPDMTFQFMELGSIVEEHHGHDSGIDWESQVPHTTSTSEYPSPGFSQMQNYDLGRSSSHSMQPVKDSDLRRKSACLPDPLEPNGSISNVPRACIATLAQENWFWRDLLLRDKGKQLEKRINNHRDEIEAVLKNIRPNDSLCRTAYGPDHAPGRDDESKSTSDALYIAASDSNTRFLPPDLGACEQERRAMSAIESHLTYTHWKLLNKQSLIKECLLV